ncbi:MAG: TolC family protein [Mangrovibacterium sp.]
MKNLNRKNLILRQLIRKLYFLLVLPACLPVRAQECYDLSRCVLSGLENNFSVRIARKEQDAAALNVTRGNAGALPVINAESGFGGTVNTTRQTPREGEKQTSRGIHNTSGGMGLDLDLTLFRGFQVRTTYRKLEELRRMGELNTQMTMENLVSQIVSEYYYYIQQLNLYNNMAYAVELSRERVRIDEERYLLGASSKLDLLQSMVYLNEDSSRYARQNEVLRSSLIRLSTLMGIVDGASGLKLQDTTILINPGLNYKNLLTLTLAQNTSLLVARKNREISELDYKIIVSRSYPYLSLSSGYNYDIYGYDSGSLEKQRIHGMNYQLSLEVDLFDGQNRRREKATSRIELENRKYAYQEVEQQVRAELQTLFFAYENHLRLLELEKQNLSVARENLEIALERYKLGALSGLELREVQKSLLDAEERLISVKYETKIAEISLFQISGKIMDYV